MFEIASYEISSIKNLVEYDESQVAQRFSRF